MSSAPQPFGPLLASRATAGVRFFEPDHIVSCVVPGVYIWVSSSLHFYVIGWHWVCVIQLVSYSRGDDGCCGRS